MQHWKTAAGFHRIGMIWFLAVAAGKGRGEVLYNTGHCVSVSCLLFCPQGCVTVDTFVAMSMIDMCMCNPWAMGTVNQQVIIAPGLSYLPSYHYIWSLAVIVAVIHTRLDYSNSHACLLTVVEQLVYVFMLWFFFSFFCSWGHSFNL